MTNPDILSNIRQDGWSPVDFEVSEAERALYAIMANRVIDIAAEDPAVKAALQNDIVGAFNTPPVRPGLYGAHGAQHSGDDKVWLHLGYQSRQRANSILAEPRQPEMLRELWPIHEAMLNNVETVSRATLHQIGAKVLEPIVYPQDTRIRNVHLRTVRYVGAVASTPDEEIVAGHADQGLFSLHIYESHHGYMMAAPYPKSLMHAPQDEQRAKAVADMRRRDALHPMDVGQHQAAFFLGAGWHGLPADLLPSELQELPAAYHVGYKAVENEASATASQVAGNADDRVVTVAFMHPNTVRTKSRKYRVPTVAQCRPDYDL